MNFESDTGRQGSSTSGVWRGNDGVLPETGEAAIKQALFCVSRPLFAVKTESGTGVATHGRAELFADQQPEGGGAEYPLTGYAPPLPPDRFGDPGFKRLLGLRYPYVAGAMANGITSVRMVQAMARAGMVGFFGAAGLPPAKVEAAVNEL